jgi:hypothetical protein
MLNESAKNKKAKTGFMNQHTKRPKRSKSPLIQCYAQEDIPAEEDMIKVNNEIIPVEKSWYFIAYSVLIYIST